MPVKSLHSQLLDGLNVKSRPDGSVHTVRAADGKTVVAEVCVGKKATRLNVRELPAKVKAPKNLELGGKSKSWPGGGVIVTDANVKAARALLASVVDATKAAPKAADAAALSSAAQTAVKAARKRTTPKRSTVKAA
jgi:hypothetical protein